MRLASIPGVGYLTATAILSATGDAKQFVKARDMAAWIGLVPAQYSTGGKANLLGVSKRGNAPTSDDYLSTGHGRALCTLIHPKTALAAGSTN